MNTEEAVLLVEKLLEPAPLNQVQESVFRQTWEGHSYLEIANTSGYEFGYVKDVGSKLWQSLSKVLEEKVTKNNLQSVLKRRFEPFSRVAIYSPPPEAVSISHTSCFNKHQDWGETIDVSAFYGRTAELSQLEEWIVKERCRLITLLGMGGIGKTSLSIKLAEQIQDKFEYVIWRSLRNAPLVEDMLADLLAFLSNQQEVNLPPSLDGKISRLMYYLRQHRCLVILDNAESLLQAGVSEISPLAQCYGARDVRAGCYREGYEGYGQLFRCVAEVPHQSCLVLTSREKPKGLNAKEGQNLPVRCLQVLGLTELEGQEILIDKGIFCSENQGKLLIETYGGNPLSLKIIATNIIQLFDGDPGQFLANKILVFGEVCDLLEQQFERLSNLEQEIIYWLAINPEPVSIVELWADIVSPVSQLELLEALESLQERSLITKNRNSATFTLQPLMRDYALERFIDGVCQEINTGKFWLFNNYALLKEGANYYEIETQNCLIIQPIIERLSKTFPCQNCMKEQLNKLLDIWQDHLPIKAGYAEKNIISMLAEIGSYSYIEG